MSYKGLKDFLQPLHEMFTAQKPNDGALLSMTLCFAKEMTQIAKVNLKIS